MLKYQIALINVFWSENDINTRYFDSVEAQTTYFEKLTEGNFSPLQNFNMGNNVETAVTYRDNSSRDVDDLIKCNYAVLQKQDEEGNVIDTRYYFAYPSQDSGRQMRVTLSLDDIQTNYFKYKSTIAPCRINRACLDRWVRNADGTVSFNGNVDSKLFEREDITNVAKRLVKRNFVSLNTYFANQDINTWFDNNIDAWVYFFLDPNHTYKFNKLNSVELGDFTFEDPTFLSNENGNVINNTFAICCFPIGGKIKFIAGDNQLTLSQTAFAEFWKNNNGSEFVYGMKISNIPPFAFPSNISYHPEIEDYTISGDTLTLNIGVTYGDFSIPFQNVRAMATSGVGVLPTIENGFLFVRSQAYQVETAPFSIHQNLTFNVLQIIGHHKDPKYNPKLLSSDFCEFQISDQTANGFSYDIQKLNMKTFNLLYTEPLTPDITKSYIRVKSPNGVYIAETDTNFTGYVGSNDMSLPLVSTAYQQMLANNKNFFLQNVVNTGANFVSGVGKTARNALQGNMLSAINEGANTISGLVTDALDLYFTIDNMRNRPSDIQNAKGNVLLNMMSSKVGVYIDEYDILPNEKNIINDFMFMNGFRCNLIDNISKYDNIRYYFNYIEAEVESITAPISNLEKERLRRALQSVRFWNSDNIQYDLENYERSLIS